ncbi:MAG TPA: type III secretion inner membrane ring lipoprotein SctJ [Burkholderiaceae bacterium]
MTQHADFLLPERIAFSDDRGIATWRKAVSTLLRTSTLLLLAAAVTLLAACSETVNLQSGLNDADANEIVSLLHRSGIASRKVSSKEGVALTVDANDLSPATEIMHAAGLPRKNLSDLGQIFKKDSMISSPLEERIRYIYGLSTELENTLRQYDNVVEARVHVVLPERIAPGEPIQPSSAAVFIKYRLPFDEDAAVPQVRNLVAASIPGLGGEDGRSKVSVVLTRTEARGAVMEWEKVGPFFVQAGTAGALFITLALLVTVALCATAAAVVIGVLCREALVGKLKRLEVFLPGFAKRKMGEPVLNAKPTPP